MLMPFERSGNRDIPDPGRHPIKARGTRILDPGTGFEWFPAIHTDVQVARHHTSAKIPARRSLSLSIRPSTGRPRTHHNTTAYAHHSFNKGHGSIGTITPPFRPCTRTLIHDAR